MGRRGTFHYMDACTAGAHFRIVISMNGRAGGGSIALPQSFAEFAP